MKIVMVVNRRKVPFEFMYDGQTYKVPVDPKGVPMTEEVANHAVYKSLFAVDPYDNRGCHSVAILDSKMDSTPLDEDKIKDKVGKHLDMTRVASVEGKKFIERTLDNPLEISSEGGSEKHGVGFSGSAEGK